MKLYQNRSIKRRWNHDRVFFLKQQYDLDLGPKILDCNLIQDNVALNICGKLYQNLSISKSAKAMTKIFSKDSNFDLDLGPIMLKC